MLLGYRTRRFIKISTRSINESTLNNLFFKLKYLGLDDFCMFSYFLLLYINIWKSKTYVFLTVDFTACTTSLRRMKKSSLVRVSVTLCWTASSFFSIMVSDPDGFYYLVQPSSSASDVCCFWQAPESSIT